MLPRVNQPGWADLCQLDRAEKKDWPLPSLVIRPQPNIPRTPQVPTAGDIVERNLR